MSRGIEHFFDLKSISNGLLNADSNSGLDVKFNKFAPPIALSVGTFSPWNSQNTLFHKSAFHTLFLPTTVSFRTTDIWRSFILQKILHLSGLTVSFVPTNTIQFRNAHDYLKDFKNEKQVYEDSGKIIEFLNDWKCSKDINLEDCINNLSEDLVENNLWGEDDSKLIKLFLNDLKSMGRMNLEFELIDPKKYDQESIRKAEQKLNYFGDLVDWCNETGYSNLSKSFLSAKQLSEKHEESYVLQQDKNSVCSLNSSIFKPKYSIIKVLIAVNNYPWKYGVGLIQRLYQPYFAAVIFCGSWYSDEVIDVDNYTSTLNPINYIHMNPAEIHKGYFAYHCVTLVKEMRLNNVKGYFLVADDTIFNIWQRIDYSRVHHLMGPVAEQHGNNWWNGKHGIPAAKNIVLTIKNNTDPKIEKAWKQFDQGLKTYGYMKDNHTVFDEIASGKGKSISDFFYIPTSQSEYYAVLMRVFYENLFFLELAVNKFVKSVDHQVARKGRRAYLWGNRNNWDTYYSKQMVAMHPIKTSQFQKTNENRKKYCGSVLQTWSDIIFGGSQNFTVKADDDPDRTVE
ncbi:hypothetical protein CRE_01640 [Caenorhabditis remanei]|uniref:Uncharacterized protein n=1 Tax=Caenorhabditis remanei TaxID=31234 RepID=E3LGX8_CAERE|nr:hypothetical protein CRE_01640 [Caenorhabditis remanei]